MPWSERYQPLRLGRRLWVFTLRGWELSDQGIALISVRIGLVSVGNPLCTAMPVPSQGTQKRSPRKVPRASSPFHRKVLSAAANYSRRRFGSQPTRSALARSFSSARF